jgi:hypothetical protein
MDLEAFRGIVEAIGGGFWGLLALLALLGSGVIVFCLRGERASAGRRVTMCVYMTFLTVLAVAATVVARQAGVGDTRPRPPGTPSSGRGWDMILPTLLQPPVALAADTRSGWIYAGALDASGTALSPRDAYVFVPGAEPGRKPRRGDVIRLLRPVDLYDRPPAFSTIYLRWVLGERRTESPLRAGSPFEVAGECAVIAKRDLWCPVRAP